MLDIFLRCGIFISMIWFLPALVLTVALIAGNALLMAPFTPALLLASYPRRSGGTVRCALLAWFGLAATTAGDFFLIFTRAPIGSKNFLFGVAGFSVAQILWISFSLLNGRPNLKIFFAAAAALSLFFAARIHGAVNSATFTALLGYALLSSFSLAAAWGVRGVCGKNLWGLAVSCLFVSDMFIALSNILGMKLLSPAVGAVYVAALVLAAVAVSKFGKPYARTFANFAYFRNQYLWVSAAALAAFICFASAVWFFPGDYNPFSSMLSKLGRTRINGFNHPLCAYFFMLGMFVSIMGVAYSVSGLRVLLETRAQKTVLMWSAALVCSGMAVIALVPENTVMFVHNIGCFAAAFGGAVVALNFAISSKNKKAEFAWLAYLLIVTAAFAAALLSAEFKFSKFSPWVPSLQKVMIVSFVLYYASHCLKASRLISRRRLSH